MLTRPGMRMLLAVALVVSSGAAACDRPGGGNELLRYVSLGDSVPSGAGLPDASGPCQRSPSAYPSLLAEQADLLPSLRACSGAATEDILERAQHPGEGRQLDWLAADTDVVTLTIGGNDIGFARVVGVCLTTTESCSRLEGEINGRIAGLRQRLDLIHGEIRRRLPKARLLVVGYPRLIVDHQDAELDRCARLGAAARITAEEAEWLRKKGDALDAALRESAEAAGGRFVDAAGHFEGHEACSRQPWVHGVAEGDLTSSFHPNAAGHQALARLVARELRRG
ncbi:MAG: SGNH/GDSL hydrolase family protein [Actinomycetota bacterium]|nr:SGNH/GDSL hydrolase family protein [Actinomycetota bacterium]